MKILLGLFGMSCLLALAWGLSKNRRSINWRTVGGAFLMQVGIGALVLYVPIGKSLLASFSHGVQDVISFAHEGTAFLFGSVGTPKTLGFIFAFHVLPTIIFFASLMAVLYHLKIMPLIINTLGGGLRRLLGTSRAESLSATANIFVGMTEAPLVVRPFVARMSESELFALMVGGLASVAGSVLSGYVEMGVDLNYLIAASFMAAPGGLLMAKIMLPETGKNTDATLSGTRTEQEDDKPANVLDAAAQGASNGLMLAANIGAMLLAFTALIAMVNGMLGGIGDLFGFANHSLDIILGYLFAPIAWILGVPLAEIQQAGSLIGEKLAMNEFIAFQSFTAVKETLSAHTQAIVTFALCGFANFSSLAILLGGIAVMAPQRRPDIARLGLRAVIAASLANFMSAAIAGLFLTISAV